MPAVSHSGTYMTQGHSIELQYPEMNSNGTMTNYHSLQTHSQHHTFQQTNSIPTTSIGASLYLPHDASQVACYDSFTETGEFSLFKLWSYSSLQFILLLQYSYITMEFSIKVHPLSCENSQFPHNSLLSSSFFE